MEHDRLSIRQVLACLPEARHLTERWRRLQTREGVAVHDFDCDRRPCMQLSERIPKNFALFPKFYFSRILTNRNRPTHRFILARGIATLMLSVRLSVSYSTRLHDIQLLSLDTSLPGIYSMWSHRFVHAAW